MFRVLAVDEARATSAGATFPDSSSTSSVVARDRLASMATS